MDTEENVRTRHDDNSRRASFSFAPWNEQIAVTGKDYDMRVSEWYQSLTVADRTLKKRWYAEETCSDSQTSVPNLDRRVTEIILGQPRDTPVLLYSNK